MDYYVVIRGDVILDFTVGKSVYFETVHGPVANGLIKMSSFDIDTKNSEFTIESEDSLLGLGINKMSWGQLSVFIDSLGMIDSVNPFDDMPTSSIKCECGKDKHNFMFHSHWCPKWDNYGKASIK